MHQLSHSQHICCVALTMVDIGGQFVQCSCRMQRDRLVVRALVRITGEPGFDPQLLCLNFSTSLSRYVSAFFLLTGNALIEVIP